ncbi:MAG TPA: WecB/TagA/CpsF family glycosyltransferase [Vicinamibacteria bacterium]|nr:WecB/TagA/CpsF family glycosyltransferase [Vicinamibacteria bacterium]
MNEKVNILGIGVSPINTSKALRTLDEWIEKREKHYVTITSVHGIVESQSDRELKRIHNRAGMVTPDGMPLVWLSRLQGFATVDRVCGPEFLPAVCEHSVNRRYRHYFYGGKDGVADLLRDGLTRRFPGLEVVGTFSPPFRALTEEEDQRIVATLNEANPDIVWVGLSTPKQERWMAAHADRLQAPVLIGVGAAFDFNAGLLRRAPRWMQRSGLEWLFRLSMEPSRLWKRYLRNNPQFLWLVFQQMLGLKRFEYEV